MDNVIIGSNVTIEDDVIIGNNCVVGNGALIKSGCILEPNSILGGGSILHDNTIIKTNEVWAGNNATFLRNITELEKENIQENIKEFLDLGLCHAHETEKTTWEQIGEVIYREQSQLSEIDTSEHFRKLREMMQLRDLTRVKRTSMILPELNEKVLDDDGSNIVPDEFVTYTELMKDNFATNAP